MGFGMGLIELQEGAIQVDAAVVAEGLGIDPSVVQERMRRGEITSRCELGTGEDKGRYRLTFFAERRRLRLVIDQAGNVVERSIIDPSTTPRSGRGPS